MSSSRPVSSHHNLRPINRPVQEVDQINLLFPFTSNPSKLHNQIDFAVSGVVPTYLPDTSTSAIGANTRSGNNQTGVKPNKLRNIDTNLYPITPSLHAGKLRASQLTWFNEVKTASSDSMSMYSGSISIYKANNVSGSIVGMSNINNIEKLGRLGSISGNINVGRQASVTGKQTVDVETSSDPLLLSPVLTKEDVSSLNRSVILPWTARNSYGNIDNKMKTHDDARSSITDSSVAVVDNEYSKLTVDNIELVKRSSSSKRDVTSLMNKHKPVKRETESEVEDDESTVRDKLPGFSDWESNMLSSSENSKLKQQSDMNQLKDLNRVHRKVQLIQRSNELIDEQESINESFEDESMSNYNSKPKERHIHHHIGGVSRGKCIQLIKHLKEERKKMSAVL